MADLKIETDLITSIPVTLIGQAVILVIMHVKTMITDLRAIVVTITINFVSSNPVQVRCTRYNIMW